MYIRRLYDVGYKKHEKGCGSVQPLLITVYFHIILRVSDAFNAHSSIGLNRKKEFSLKIKLKTPAGQKHDIYKNADEDLLSASSSASFVSVFSYSKETC